MKEFKVIFPGNKKVDVQFNDFLVKTDQSKKNKGDETAPEPFDIFCLSDTPIMCHNIVVKCLSGTKTNATTIGKQMKLFAFFITPFPE